MIFFSICQCMCLKFERFGIKYNFICNTQKLALSKFNFLSRITNLLEKVPRTLPSNLAATESQSLTAISAATFLAEKYNYTLNNSDQDCTLKNKKLYGR